MVEHGRMVRERKGEEELGEGLSSQDGEKDEIA